MSDRGPARLPVICRMLIGAASWLVPGAQREQWLRKWRDSAGHWWAFLHEREEFLLRDGFQHLLIHCTEAFADAFWIRFPRERVHAFLRGPSFVLLSALAAIVATGVLSGGFPMLRSAKTPLPYKAPEQLVTVSQEAMLGRYGNPRRQVKRWGERAKTLREIAAWSEWPARRGFATPNLFPMLGVKPILGRTFNGEEWDAVVLTYRHWMREYDGDPRAVGRTILVAGSPMEIIGVLPPSDALPGFPEPPMWTVLGLSCEQPRRLVDTIARLKPGVKPEAARAELERLAGSEPKTLVRDVRVDPFRAPLQGRALLYLITPAIGVLLGVILVAIAGHSPVAGHVHWQRRVRCWAFLVLKSVLVLGALTAFWIEAATSCASSQPDTEMREVMGLLAAIIPTWSFILLSALAVVWCIADQRKRCPVCLHRLSLPVTIGSLSHPLLDPATTEFLCEQGHGSLAVPETQASTAEPERWTTMDESWRDLFISK